ncbi:hypothetical protein PRIPAC_77301 [Pristionchus pacificus]|uniref:acid phosphatase n=1 Tax=Pristionchus pacificus TaxID=54126 RepID=A0A2A6CKK1_PRIPA|nr:hypothetical protein PRIPAC_77301 [Pristionchus pacificus]|eukprot:PDM78636.1 Phosphatase [Pristionchus pacificus]
MNSLLLIGIVVATSDELLSVNVVIRHGDRAATSGWATPESSTILFRGPGELTDHQNHFFALGRNSASFTNALFKKSPKDHAVVPPIYTKDVDSDGLLVPLLTCQDGWEDVVSRFNLSSTVDVQKTALVAMMVTEWPAACSTVNPGLIDAIVSELPNKKINMPANYKACAEGPAKEFMYKYIQLLAGAGDHYNEKRIKRVAGLQLCYYPCPGQPKLRIYYTHDVNVLALSHIFGILDRFNGVTPAFSSALVFETRRNANGTYVKIFQKNGQKADFVDTNNCASDCSLATVTSGASPLAITAQIPCA